MKETKSISEYSDSFDPQKEDKKRERYIKYFRKAGKGNSGSHDGKKAYILAAVIIVFGVIIAPGVIEKIGIYLSTMAVTMFRLLMIFTAAIVAFLGHVFQKQGKKETTADEEKGTDLSSEIEYDNDLKEDLELLKLKSYKLINEWNEDLTYDRDSIKGVKPFLVIGPDLKPSKKMFPFRCIVGADGLLNYSTIKAMVIYRGKKSLYIHMTSLNLCDGISDDDHVYYCEYENIENIDFDDYDVYIDENGSEKKIRSVRSFGITSKSGDTRRIFVDVVNYDLQEKLGGKCDIRMAVKALNSLKDTI